MTPTIVLVHGAWHGSWCWHNVVQALEAEGFAAIAVDLPGRSPGSSKRIWHRMSEYVAHVDDVVAGVDGPVVLVGHSMGGLVTQRVLEDRSLDGAVLVASVPRRGVSAALLRLVREEPRQVLESNVAVSMWPLVANDERVRGHFFGDETDEAVVIEAGKHLQNESFVAYLSMLFRPPRPNAVATPVHVVAAEHDTIFSLAEQHDLAKAYGQSEAVVLDGAHDLMLEPVWPELVDEVIRVARHNASA